MSKQFMRLTILAAALVTMPALAQFRFSNVAVKPSFVGPDAIEHLVESDSRAWTDWQAELRENHGFAIGADYAATFLSANDTAANDTAAGGIARVYGIINIIENGVLMYKVEHRHGFGDPAPAGFGLSELGYAGTIERPFNDDELTLQNLYWRQTFNGGRATLLAGILDATDFIDTFALASPWQHFMNASFSNGSNAIGLPNDAAVGLMYGTLLADNIYLVGSLTDANGDATEPLEGFGNFLSDNEYFKSIEIGWSPDKHQVLFDNMHLTAWHKDRQSGPDIEDGWGLAFSLSRFVNDRFMPFVRGGYAKDGGTMLQKSLSIGMGYQTAAFDGMFGAAFNWGDPNESTFQQGLQDQWTVELFYRIPILRWFRVTGDIQYIKDPALNPSDNTIWLFNVRVRAAF